MEEQIEKLLLSQNYGKEFCISKNDQLHIVDSIQKIQNVPLENLHLWNIERKTILHIFNTFQNLNLKKFTTSDCEIDSEIASCIARFIPNLISVNLDGDKIQTDAFIIIIDTIKYSHSCSALTLRDVIFDENKTAALVDCIERGQLINLELNRCRFERTRDVDSLVSIMGSMACSSMQTLFLGDINFDYKTTSALVQCITNSRLIKLSLFGCTFVGNKIATIMTAVQSSAIQSLDIGFSYFIDSISDVIGCIHNSSVIKFIFGDVKRRYCDEEMIVIANSIRDGNLSGIGFNYISINEEIFDSIKSSSITFLDLYPYPFDNTETIETNIVAICELLEQCKLRKLKIALRKADDHHIQTILSSIKKSELIKLHIYDAHRLSTDIKREIKETMREQKLRAATFNKMKSAGTIFTGTISTGIISTGIISTGIISTGIISAGIISTGIISAGTISADTISAGTITVKVENNIQ